MPDGLVVLFVVSGLMLNWLSIAAAVSWDRELDEVEYSAADVVSTSEECGLAVFRVCDVGHFEAAVLT